MPEDKPKAELQVCLNRRPSDCCDSRNALQLYRELKKRYAGQLKVRPTTCLGLCKQGPAMKLILDEKEHLMVEATLENVQRFMEQHGI